MLVVVKGGRMWFSHPAKTTKQNQTVTESCHSLPMETHYSHLAHPLCETRTKGHQRVKCLLLYSELSLSLRDSRCWSSFLQKPKYSQFNACMDSKESQGEAGLLIAVCSLHGDTKRTTCRIKSLVADTEDQRSRSMSTKQASWTQQVQGFILCTCRLTGWLQYKQQCGKAEILACVEKKKKHFTLTVFTNTQLVGQTVRHREQTVGYLFS